MHEAFQNSLIQVDLLFPSVDIHIEFLNVEKDVVEGKFVGD